ncbi:hypothetical protein HUJ04_010787 [Dendroctonus ponderosae]|nr:hypothetical protein HUJ04_010787 [Dendroctonus ponderosae]
MVRLLCLMICFAGAIKLAVDNDVLQANICYMYQSGFSTVQKPPKIFAQKRKKQVAALTSAERGQHVAIAVWMATVATKT